MPSLHASTKVPATTSSKPQEVPIKMVGHGYPGRLGRRRRETRTFSCSRETKAEVDYWHAPGNSSEEDNFPGLIVYLLLTDNRLCDNANRFGPDLLRAARFEYFLGDSGMSILVIEDSRFLRTAIERILAKAGYSVTGVADGREGLLAARTGSPKLILLDMMLPGLDGTGVLKALKQDTSTAHIPVIVLTGLSQRNETTLKNAGAAAYIEKSSLDLMENANALIESVESVLRQSVATAADRARQISR